ncbi:ABC transporter ATP-binding protein [Dactylosporangium sp. CA-092794]|uniref:ABC transporter ATP-binding protein n=1 Tax=Dactylosporangium sp. CA-092794 TaxID=3239929 RepID=UPI003D94B913
MTALTVTGLNVDFGRGRRIVHAVRDVGFEIAHGTTLGLVGESGSGKSTVARAVSGLVRPAGGSIGRPGGGKAHGVQMVFQDPFSSLNPRMTVGRMFTEALQLVDSKRTADELARLVHLPAEMIGKFPHELSGGQRQRVAIGRALAVDPKVLILDEVTAALDVSIQAAILDMLTQLQAELGFAALFISHDLAVVRQVCDEVAVMYLGHIVELADAESLFRAPQHPYTRSLLAAIPGSHADERLRALGEPADPAFPPAGCHFHPRCPVGPRVRTDRAVCAGDDPFPGAGQRPHRVACHFPGEVA